MKFHTITTRHLFLLIISIAAWFCSTNAHPYIMATSISSDGQYAITTQLQHRLTLWDIAHKKPTVLSNHANIYSAYFIPNTHRFMWQDLQNTVHIQDIHGHTIRTFQLPYAAYGACITPDLTHHVTSDIHWQLHSTKQKFPYTPRYASFLSIGKLLQLQLSPDGNTLLTAGDGNGNKTLWGLTLWNMRTHQPIHSFPYHAGKTTATFSPDGRYIVSGDENGHIFLWNTHNPALLLKISPTCHDPLTQHIGLCKTMLHHNRNIVINHVLQIKFINHNHYLVFTPDAPYAILYDISHTKPIKYLKLAHPITEYARASAIDTAPQAHILMVGKDVYHPTTGENRPTL